MSDEMAQDDDLEEIRRSLSEIDKELESTMARRMKVWRVRLVLTAVLVAVAHYYHHNLWWLWFIPLASLLLMGFMHARMRKRLAKLDSELKASQSDD